MRVRMRGNFYYTNMRIKDISPEGVISAEREGHRTSKLHADRIILQADPFASIEGSSKDHPWRYEVDETDSIFDRDVSKVDRKKSRFEYNNRPITRQRLHKEAH
jgi:hypothetical protein